MCDPFSHISNSHLWQHKGAAGGQRQGQPHVGLLQLGVDGGEVERNHVLVLIPFVEGCRGLHTAGAAAGAAGIAGKGV